MRTFQVKLFPLLIVLFTVAISPLWGLAQEAACADMAVKALQNLGKNCDGLDRNSACYGNQSVSATFNQSVADGFFSKLGDRSPTVQIASLTTSPLDTSRNEWGIAMMNVQADVPDPLAGQGLNVIVLGDVTVNNNVAPEDVLPPVTPINVTTRAAANLRSGPGTNTDVIISIPARSQLSADSLSEGRNWLRVLYQNRTVWISRDSVNADGSLDNLPAINIRNRTPMQALSFHSAIGAPRCNEAPSLMVIQGPTGAQANIRANGANITLGSTIVLRLLPGNLMELSVVDGSARVGNLGIPHGFKVVVALTEDGTDLAGPWTDFARLSSNDLAQFAILEQIPANLLHYTIQLPTEGEIQAMLAEFGSTSQGGQSNPTASQADCKNFRLTSPLQGLPGGGNVKFFWDAAPGATSYRVDITNDSGTPVATYSTTGPATSLNGDVSSLGAGTFFTIEVTALVKGETACISSPVTVSREAVCNRNEKCEPWLGENSANCSDCSEGG
jgi:SH3 domain-containing protein